MVDTVVSGWLHKVKGLSPEEKELARMEWLDRAHPILREFMKKNIEFKAEKEKHGEV
jgi:hypothetical protein